MSIKAQSAALISQGEEPQWKTKDRLGQKNGPHATVYLVNGDQYIGEWKDNLKHGLFQLIEMI